MDARKQKGKLRVIDQGTVYDVPGKLIRLAREIRAGKHGRVVAAVVCVRQKFDDGDKRTDGYWYGQETFEEALMMLEVVKRDFMR